MAVLLPPLAAHLAKVAARDEGRYSMAGVRVLDPGDGTYRLEATDGRRAAILRGYNLDTTPLPELPEADPSVRAGEGVVPLADWIDGFKMVPAARVRRPQAPLALVLRRDDVCMTTVGAQRQARLLDGRFPSIDRVLPSGPAVVSFQVNPKLLIELLQIALAVCGDDPKVTIHFWKDGAPVGLSCMTAEHGGVFLDGLVMPLE